LNLHYHENLKFSQRFISAAGQGQSWPISGPLPRTLKIRMNMTISRSETEVETGAETSSTVNTPQVRGNAERITTLGMEHATD